ncbi:MAG: ribosome small subunit-dependent GTPase A [Bryobacteraceae bacterium]
MNLELLGASARVRGAFGPYLQRGLALARVAVAHRDLYRLYTEAGEIAAEPSGALWYGAADTASMPVVGDWVAARIVNSEQAIVETVLPRHSCFYRRAVGKREERQAIAANLDLVFLVCGLDADFNLRRIERYLTLAADSGVAPAIVLNKADVCADPSARARDVAAISKAPVVTLSALAREGIAQLEPFLACAPTVALLGSSGAGKSTIANALLGEDRLRTGAVRESDSRGRHTTTHRELLPLPGGGALIDTPGMRELQLWAGAESVGEVFGEIAALAAECRFGDCSHSNEPGCAVAKALAVGALAQDRWESYRKLRAEAHRHEARADARVAQEDKRKLKRMMKDVRRLYQSRR